MKKFLFMILLVCFITSCAVSNRVVTLGNVSVLSPTGERIRSYNNVVLKEVPLQDTLTSVYFVEQNGTEHYIDNQLVVVEGVEQIVESERVTSTTSVVVYPYGYHYPYYNTYYYHYYPYYYRHRVVPRPQPRPRPDVRPAPNHPRPNHGPRPNGPSSRPTPPNNRPGRR